MLQLGISLGGLVNLTIGLPDRCCTCFSFKPGHVVTRFFVTNAFTAFQVGKDHAYNASRSVTEPEFKSFMLRLHNIAPDAHDKLNDIPHELWAHYASRTNVCWDQVTTNPAESANSMLLEVSFSRKIKYYSGWKVGRGNLH